MRGNCDASISYEESRGGMNFFATKKVYRGSFDGKIWYGAGDVVYYGANKNRMLESKILEVEFDGSVLVENKIGIFSCSVQEMKLGHLALGKAYDCGHDGVLAVRCIEQFTIDLLNWFAVEQRCIIKTDNVTFVGAWIEGISSNGNIHIFCNGKEEIIHYSQIKDIKDYYENTRYLFIAKKPGKKPPAAIKKNIRAKTKNAS